MDTSKKYIEMCGRAVELHTNRIIEVGDWLFNPSVGVKVVSDKVIHVKNDRGQVRMAIPKNMTLTSPISESNPIEMTNTLIDYIDFEIHPENSWVKLYRQDQLFNMCPALSRTSLLSGLLEHAKRNGGIFVTMEQIILSYLMQTYHNKVWVVDHYRFEEVK